MHPDVRTARTLPSFGGYRMDRCFYSNDGDVGGVGGELEIVLEMLGI